MGCWIWRGKSGCCSWVDGLSVFFSGWFWKKVGGWFWTSIWKHVWNIKSVWCSDRLLKIGHFSAWFYGELSHFVSPVPPYEKLFVWGLEVPDSELVGQPQIFEWGNQPKINEFMLGSLNICLYPDIPISLIFCWEVLTKSTPMRLTWLDFGFGCGSRALLCFVVSSRGFRLQPSRWCYKTGLQRY